MEKVKLYKLLQILFSVLTIIFLGVAIDFAIVLFLGKVDTKFWCVLFFALAVASSYLFKKYRKLKIIEQGKSTQKASGAEDTFRIYTKNGTIEVKDETENGTISDLSENEKKG